MKWYDAAVLAPPEPASVPRSRGHYCALMGHPFEGYYKKDTFMFVSSAPVHTAVVHNRRLVNNKETRQVAPFWHLLVVVGPFAAAASALAFGRDWTHNTRGWQSKRRRGMELARARGLPYYVTPMKPRNRKRTLAYLRRHAPPAYAETYVRLTTRAKRAVAG